MTVGSVVVHSVPYTRGRLREPIPPCDVLATHSPPKGVLDLCYSGGHGGCRFLRSSVEAANGLRVTPDPEAQAQAQANPSPSPSKPT